MDNSTQIINIQLNENSQKLLAQSRSGLIYILEFEYNILSEYDKKVIKTENETFTKFLFLQNNKSFKILMPSKSEGSISVINDDNMIDDIKYKDKNIKNSLINVLSSLEGIEEVFISFENSVIAVIHKQDLSKIKTAISLFEGHQETNSVITISLYKETLEDCITVYVGLFCSEIIILKYHISKNTFIRHDYIKNCCSDLKPGISSISFFEDLVVTGAYDFRIRIYKKTEKEVKFLGFTKLENQAIIHKVELYPYDDRLYLFIASDQPFFYIFVIKD
jgi:hypothetical protein